MKSLVAAAMATAILMSPAAFAQEDASADNRAILLEKVRADKKLLVASNMNLTEQEGAAFWPVYEAYQKDLDAMNKRIMETVKRYSDAFGQGSGTISDDVAKSLLNDALDIEADEVDLRKSYVPKFSKVLPAGKVARYYQIESKIRTAVKADLASGIPLITQ